MVVHGRTGWLVPADDPAATAERLLHLLSDHEARRRMGREARLRVEAEFSVEALGRRSAEVVRAVIADGRPPPADGGRHVSPGGRVRRGPGSGGR